MRLDEWIETYAQAWREADAMRAADLFTDEAIYCEHLLQDPAHGREAIEQYWREATATQSGIDVQFGDPIVADAKVAVEFWTRMNWKGDDVTAAGCLLLRFAPDGLCEELREYWFVEPGTHAPPAIWGR